MLPKMTPEEQAAHRLIFQEHLPVTEASQKLSEQGIKATPQQLLAFKHKIADKLIYLQRQEAAVELALDSYERIKFEFENILAETKRLLEIQKKLGNTDKQLAVLQQLTAQIALALKAQGKLDKQALSIAAKNINLISPSTLSESFKHAQEAQFRNMQATYENGKLIYNNPTPEIIDDFNRWRAKQLRESKIVDINA